jgi:hypothetical protein
MSATYGLLTLDLVKVSSLDSNELFIEGLSFYFPYFLRYYDY